jgi:hypothetical protein
MQQLSTQPPQTPGKIAFRQGLTFGLCLAGGAFVFLLLETFAVSGGISFLLTILTFLGALALYFLAGMRTTRAAGTVGMGAIAGLWAGVFYGLINTILAPIIVDIAFNANVGIYAPNSITADAASTVGSFVIGAIILANIGGWILAIGFGAGAGAIGGLVAKNQLQPAAPGAAGYPAQPYTGQPMPYGQQPYPGQPTPYGQQPYPGQPTSYGQQPYPGQPTDSPPPPNPYS